MRKLGWMMGIAVVATAAVADVKIVEDGKPVAKVFVSRTDPAAKELVNGWQDGRRGARFIREDREAALRDYFSNALFDLVRVVEKSSGARLEIVTVEAASEITEPAVVIGSLARECGVRPVAHDDYGQAFVIRTEGRRVYLAGEGRLGDVYAVYALLNDAGCEWVMPGELGEVVPESRTWSASASREESPSFRIRAPWESSLRDKAGHNEYVKWQIRNREQVRILNRGIDMYEDRMDWHFYPRKNWDKWFAEHPECAARVFAPDGTVTYNRSQLNTTAPASVELELMQLRELWARNGWGKDERHIVRWGPADNDSFDNSAESLAINQARPEPICGGIDQTDIVYRFMRRVLERAVQEFPNVILMTLVYNRYEGFPSREDAKPHPNARFFIADISPSRLHGACDAAISPTRAYYKRSLEAWAACGRPPALYHYNWNLAEGTLPYSRLRIIGEDLPYEHSLGIPGYFDEQAQGLSYSAAHDWLLAKMMWNVKLDWRRETERFCRLAYGGGWREMYDYWMRVTDRHAQSGDESGAFYAARNLWTRAEWGKLNLLLTAAQAKCARPEERRRVAVAAYSVKQLGNFLDFTEAYGRYDFRAASAAVAKMLSDDAAERGGDYPNSAWRSSAKMIERRIKRFADGALAYSTGANRIVAKIPERMRMQVNPNFTGAQLNLQSPKLKDGQFPEVSTWSTTVSAQGLTTIRSGELWYRTKMPTPEVRLDEGEGIGLFLGGFDNQATVYVNGVSAGTCTGFARPGVWDVTELLNRNGEENSIVFCIARTANSEAMTGGILYPGFLFCGPRVKPADKSSSTPQIVVPGMGN